MDYYKTIKLSNFLISKERYNVKRIALLEEYENANESSLIRIMTVSGWSMHYYPDNPVFALINEIIPDDCGPCAPLTDEVKGLGVLLSNVYIFANYIDAEFLRAQSLFLQNHFGQAGEVTQEGDAESEAILRQLKTANEMEQLLQERPEIDNPNNE